MVKIEKPTKVSTLPKYFGLNQLRQLELLKTSTNTLDELENYLILSFGLFLDPKSDEIMDIIELVNQERIIEKLEKINEISDVNEKEQQLIRLVIQEGSGSLKSNVYFEYLENYNGDIIYPTQSPNKNSNFNSSLWMYTQYYFSQGGLNYLINNKIKGTKTHTHYYHIKPNISKDQFIQFLKVYFGQTEIDYGNTFIEILLFQIISGNIIDGISLKSTLEIIKDIYSLLRSKDKIDSFNKTIPKAFERYIKLFNQSKEVYDINFELVQDLKPLPQLPLDKYKWLIGHCNSVILQSKSRIVNPYGRINSLYMCIDSKELADFILNNKEFFLLGDILRPQPIHFNIKESSKINFGSFEIAKYFRDELFKIIQSTLSKDKYNGPTTHSNDRQLFYKSLFFKSILNCDIQEMNHFIGLIPTLNFKRDIAPPKPLQKKYRSNNFQQIQKDIFTKDERDQILQSKFYNDQESRNTFLNHLNNNNFKCFTYSTFDYLKRSITIDPTSSTEESTSTPASTSPINEFKFENQYSNFVLNSYLSMDYLLNSIYKLNFKSVEMILNLPNFNISISDIETIIMNDTTQFSFDITYGTYQSKFKYQDIKEMLLLLIKVLPLPESNLSIQYIYFHLYKCLLQSIGIEMNHLIEIHNIYNSIGITNELLFKDNKLFHLFYWIHLKNKKLSRVLTCSDTFGRNHLYNLLSSWGYYNSIEKSDGVFTQLDIPQPQLQFDFIYNYSHNDIKTILIAFIKRKKNRKKQTSFSFGPVAVDEEKEDEESENSLIYEGFGPYLFDVGELDLYLEITKQHLKEESEENWLNRLDFDISITIADSNKLEEFISLGNVRKTVEFFIEGAIENDRIDIIEKLLSIYPTETIASFYQYNNLEELLYYHSIPFLKYMFQNHYSIIYNHFEKQMKNDSNLSTTNSTSTGGGKRKKDEISSPFFRSIFSSGFDYCELLLKHIPQLFKFTPPLILQLLTDTNRNNFPLIQYYYEVGTIQKHDFSIDAIEFLKSHRDLKYLKWVVDL